MGCTENMHLLGEISCDDPITRIVISDDEVMTSNPNSAWEIDRIYTDYAPKNEHKELIVVFKRKGEQNDSSRKKTSSNIRSDMF